MRRRWRLRGGCRRAQRRAPRAAVVELERALAYPKLRRRVSAPEAEAVLDRLRRAATGAPDPDGPPPTRSRDPGDDFPLTLAAAEHALLVSCDEHLLSLPGESPIYSPASFLSLLEGRAR